MERKSQYRVLDLDDLLLYWHAMMSEDRIAKSVSAHFDHVLVDEYQDTNKLQGDILMALKPDGQGVTVVGDDAQAIYSFRAAAVENILGFPDRFRPKAEVVTLAQNFRSSQSMLDAANALMADAPRQYRKHLLSMRGQGPRPKLVTVDDLPTQAEFICTRVLAAREAGVSLRRQAVLFRTGTHSDALEVELTKRKIPFVKYGGLKFLEAAHVKDLLAVLRWADNPRNQLAAFRVLQFMPGMGPANAKKALDHFVAERITCSLLSTASSRRSDASIAWKQVRRSVQDAVRAESPVAGPDQPDPRVVQAAHGTHVRARAHAHRRSRPARAAVVAVPDARAFRHRAHARSAAMPPATRPDRRARTRTSSCCPRCIPPRAWSGTRCTCSTWSMAASRTSSPTGKAELIEEERRLLYVAMTRARNDLTCVVPLRFQITSQPKTSDGHVYGGRSRFLTREGHQVLRRADLPGHQHRSEDRGRDRRLGHHRRGVASQADVVKTENGDRSIYWRAAFAYGAILDANK